MCRRTAAFIVITVTFLTAGALPVWPAHDPVDHRLTGILQRLARVAQLYRDTALKFACNEQVKTRGLGRRTFRYSYLYEYDQVEGFRDYRQTPPNVPPDQRDRRPPVYLMRAYSWAFLFSPGERDRHRYRLAWIVSALGVLVSL